jgi:hypothetical protein
MSEKLSDNGDKDFGRKLLANGLIHDNSKLDGIEWLYLNEETKVKSPELFKAALLQHNKGNPHHIEYWLRPEDMPDIYIAELVCDCSARASEFGTDVREWFKEEFTEKYGISTSSNLYRTIKKFLDMLLLPKFK